MGKWIGIVAVLGFAGAAVYGYSGRGSEADRVCAKLETLCGEATLPSEACTDELAEATPVELDRLEACVVPADSCLEVTGCLAGSAARELAQGALRGVLGP